MPHPPHRAEVLKADRGLGVAAAVASVALLAAYALRAAVLIVYPWDWSPDEGLALDYARRLAVDPASLYAKSAVPFPSAYGPLLPLLLAPIVAPAGRGHAPAARGRAREADGSRRRAAGPSVLARGRPRKRDPPRPPPRP